MITNEYTRLLIRNILWCAMNKNSTFRMTTNKIFYAPIEMHWPIPKTLYGVIEMYWPIPKTFYAPIEMHWAIPKTFNVPIEMYRLWFDETEQVILETCWSTECDHTGWILLSPYVAAFLSSCALSCSLSSCSLSFLMKIVVFRLACSHKKLM